MLPRFNKIEVEDTFNVIFRICNGWLAAHLENTTEIIGNVPIRLREV